MCIVYCSAQYKAIIYYAVLYICLNLPSLATNNIDMCFRNVSGSNISAQNISKKGKATGKGLFRRLSGGKGDKVWYNS